jgi:predicted CxxxxCH...CXXCH cytochrome family protein
MNPRDSTALCPLCAAGLLALVACPALGCLKARNEQAPAAGSGACAGSCHGDTSTPAPPQDTNGSSSTAAAGVGAHRFHLNPSSTHAAVECSACHVVPSSVQDPGHTDHAPPAIVRFGGLAIVDGRQPRYDIPSRTCEDSYCHSGPPGDAPWPAQAVWNQPQSSDRACGVACHSLPPAGKHPTIDRCELCHSDTAGPNHTIKNAALHVNGRVDLVSSGCNSCHGNDRNPAPPVDVAGNSDTTSIGVGAHQRHLLGGDTTRPVRCNECHVVPSAIGDPGHIDHPLPATLAFFGVAVAHDATAFWDHASSTCSGVYCHGATLPGGSNTAPIWTRVGQGQASCGACHSIPPPPPHPASIHCEYCHHDTFAVGLHVRDATKHVNGSVDFASGGCGACHGSAQNAAPPASLSGATEASDLGVGAHQAHLAGGEFSRPVACDECHVVPTDVESHITTPPPAVLTFSSVATTDGATPVWDRTTTKCSGAYCHGSAQLGGANPTPAWTTTDPPQAACGSCHSLPPPAPHSTSTGCVGCHPNVINDQGQLIDRQKHVNGHVDF